MISFRLSAGRGGSRKIGRRGILGNRDARGKVWPAQSAEANVHKLLGEYW